MSDQPMRLGLRLRDVQAIARLAEQYGAEWVDIREQRLNQSYHFELSVRPAFVLSLHASGPTLKRNGVEILFIPGLTDDQGDSLVLLRDDRQGAAE
jgi:hypothetical protein